MNELKTPTLTYGEDNDGWYIARGDLQIAHGMTEEDAQPIVACVNACAGISSKWLEVNGVKGLYNLVNKLKGECADLEEQRDELLAALNFARQGYQASFENGDTDEVEWSEVYLRSIDVALSSVKCVTESPKTYLDEAKKSK